MLNIYLDSPVISAGVVDLTKAEVAEKWLRNNNPRVRDAWVDRTFFGTDIIWEKGQPYRLLRQDGPHRREAVPRWSTNGSLARKLVRQVGIAPPAESSSPDLVCLRALLRRLEIGPGLWGEGLAGMSGRAAVSR